MPNKLPREILANELIKGADRKLKRIRKLGAKPEQRWFGIGPKKGPLSTNEQIEKRALERTEVEDRAEGMRLKRELKSRKTSRGGGR
jgi:hypothetical protein